MNVEKPNIYGIDPESGWEISAAEVRRCWKEITMLRSLLEEANDLLRSAHQIAVREQDAPNSTGWANFQKRVDAALLGQHAVMYPKGS